MACKVKCTLFLLYMYEPMKRYFRFIYASFSKGNHNRQSSENDMGMLLVRHTAVFTDIMKIHVIEEAAL